MNRASHRLIREWRWREEGCCAGRIYKGKKRSRWFRIQEAIWSQELFFLNYVEHASDKSLWMSCYFGVHDDNPVICIWTAVRQTEQQRGAWSIIEALIGPNWSGHLNTGRLKLFRDRDATKGQRCKSKLTHSNVLWAARVWKRRMYRCCNGSSLSPQDMHCLHWKSLEARSSFHVSHYLLRLILFDTMEEDGRCFPESQCFFFSLNAYELFVGDGTTMMSLYLGEVGERGGGGGGGLASLRHWCPKHFVTNNGADNTGNAFKKTASGPARSRLARPNPKAFVGSRQRLLWIIYAKETAEKPWAD